MAKTAKEAYDEILAHIQKEGSSYPSWYCGITGDVEQRLFEEHGVPEKEHWFAYRNCSSDDDARNVEDALLRLGCDGGPGGGDSDSTYVYAYLKTNVTTP